MEKCIVDLFSAVGQIKHRYFSDIGTRADQTQYNQHTENPFTAELYFRFRSIMEDPINLEYYNDLIFQFDITKAAVGMRPDLVLHEAQQNRNNQKMFVEVKTDPTAELNEDFKKLIIATDEYLNFQTAVIVIANRPFSVTKPLVTNYFKQYDYKRRKRLFLINAEIQANNIIDYNLFQFTSIKTM